MDAGVEGYFPTANQDQSAGGDPFHRRSLLWQHGEPAVIPASNPKPIEIPNQESINMNNNNTVGVAPTILRLHPGLDQGQLEIIGHLDGPTLGIAGPGAGKTLAVALRGANILLQGRARPEELVLCTYSRAAAGELRQRFITLATDASCGGDLSRVRIVTIHGLCRRILHSDARRAGLRPSFAVLNEDEQERFLLRRFADVFAPDLDVLEREGWHWKEPHLVIRHARKYFERICDELIDPGELTGSWDPFHVALGRCYLRYRELLQDEGNADFDHLQRWAAELLEDDRIADPISDGIRHLVCDEYQDTSHVEELLLLRLSRAHGNICVVGDDDQSIYRFRGASVQNLLEFVDHFSHCRTVALNVNYRSHPDIVDCYDRWMATAADWSNPDAGGRPFRYPKSITPHNPGAYRDYPAVIAVEGRDVGDEGRRLAELVQFLKCKQVIAEYDQVALLLHSVKGPKAAGYLDALERAGISVNRATSGAGGHRWAGTRRGVIVTTIHQAKGREWDVVMVGSLNFDNPNVDPVGRELGSYRRRPAFEPAGRIADFDHARQHYVAFSRPRGLLVLTGSGPVHPRFEGIWNDLPRWAEMDATSLAALARQRFRPPESAVVTEQAPGPVRVIPYLRRLDVWVGRAAPAATKAGLQEKRRP